MSAGKLLAAAIVLSALAAGAALYYLQVYHYYEDVSGQVGPIRLTPAAGGPPEAIPTDGVQAIDAASSPIRFRACFKTTLSRDELVESYAGYPAAEPLVAPGWFDCFDADALGAALERGEALAFLGIKNVSYGIDRVVVFLPDGRGYAWQQINACGEVVFDGEPAPEGCPAPPEGV